MKTIIAGSRSFDNYNLLCKSLNDLEWNITEVVSGTARGADQLGERWAKNHKIPLTKFPADWNKYGKSAGYHRNQQMAEHGEALVAFWDGESRGTKNMIEIAKKLGLRVKVVEV